MDEYAAGKPGISSKYTDFTNWVIDTENRKRAVALSRHYATADTGVMTALVNTNC